MCNRSQQVVRDQEGKIKNILINQIEPNLNAVMTGDGPVVDTRHKYPEAVLEASADHEAEVVVGTEVKGNLQRTDVLSAHAHSIAELDAKIQLEIASTAKVSG